MTTGGDLVFDIECGDWTTFVVGAIADGERLWFETDEDALVDRLLKVGRGRTAWAHYGGRYDALWLLEHVRRRGIKWKAIMGGGAPVAIEIGEGKRDEVLTVKDSYRLWPDPLASIGELLGLPKAELPDQIKCRCGRRGCKRYCGIRREHARVLKPYLERDVRLLQRVIEWLYAIAEKHDIPLQATVGGTAWRDAEDMCGLPRADRVLPLTDAIKLRDGYYGGRVECYRLRADEGRSYDIRSAYPWALSTVPVPLSRPDWKRTCDLSDHAIVWARVWVPPTDLPPLPVRDEEAGRLAWCHGILEGAWTTIELRRAVESGAKVLEIKACAVWAHDQVVTPFGTWLTARAALRQKYGKGTPEYAWLKWLINSLTGKLAQRPIRSGICWGEPACVCKRSNPAQCVCKVALDPAGTIWSREAQAVSRSGHVGAAAFLTSRVRVELFDQLTVAGTDRVYTDTDSLYKRGMEEITRRIGPAVGEWDDEGPWSAWECHQPKVYRCERPEGSKFRVKGVPVRDRFAWDEYLGRGVEMGGVWGLKGAIRRGGPLFDRREGSRRLLAPGPLCGSRERAGDVTRAIDIERFRMLAGLTVT